MFLRDFWRVFLGGFVFYVFLKKVCLDEDVLYFERGFFVDYFGIVLRMNFFLEYLNMFFFLKGFLGIYYWWVNVVEVVRYVYGINGIYILLFWDCYLLWLFGYYWDIFLVFLVCCLLVESDWRFYYGVLEEERWWSMDLVCVNGFIYGKFVV